MSSTTMVHVRIEEQVKEKATKALEAMGLSVSDAVRVLLTRVAVEQALPFDLRVPNAKTAKAMKEARRGKLPKFATTAELLADLNADD